MYIYLPVCLSIYLSVCVSIYLSLSLCISLSIYIYIHRDTRWLKMTESEAHRHAAQTTPQNTINKQHNKQTTNK